MKKEKSGKKVIDTAKYPLIKSISRTKLMIPQELVSMKPANYGSKS